MKVDLVKTPALFFVTFVAFVCLYDGVILRDVKNGNGSHLTNNAHDIVDGDVTAAMVEQDSVDRSQSQHSQQSAMRTAMATTLRETHDAERNADNDLIDEMRRHAVADVDSDSSHPVKNTVILAITNSGNLELLQNWMSSMSRSGHTDHYILSFDQHLVTTLNEDPNFTGGVALIPTHWHASDKNSWSFGHINEVDAPDIIEQAHHWATPGYYKLTRARTHIVRHLLKHGLNVLLTDVDTVWRSSKTLDYVKDYMVARPHVEVAFALDAIDGTHLHLGRAHTSTAFYLAKSTERVVRLFDEVLRKQEENLNVHDREAMQEALAASSPSSTEFVGYFDHLLVMNGKDYFQRRVHEAYGIEPLVVHANCMVGQDTKKQAFVDSGLWYL